MRFLRLALTTAALLLPGGAATALAQGSLAETQRPQPFHVEFSPASPCGDREAFTDEILKRTDRLRPAETGEPALTFFVTLSRTPGGIRGQFAIREPEGQLSLREVPGGDCPEVLSAMALIAALTVDPLARADREIPVEARRRRPAPPPRRLPAPARTEPPAPAQEPKPPAALGLGVGQRVTAQGAVTPGVALGLGAYLELSARAARVFAPRARLGLSYSRQDDVEGEVGRADFRWMNARVQLCPLRLGSDADASVRPCAFVDAGRLEGRGEAITPSRNQAVFWTAAGLELSAGVRLAGPLVLGGELGLVLPFRRDRFYFSPDDELHRVPWAGISAALGLGLLFF